MRSWSGASLANAPRTASSSNGWPRTATTTTTSTSAGLRRPRGPWWGSTGGPRTCFPPPPPFPTKRSSPLSCASKRASPLHPRQHPLRHPLQHPHLERNRMYPLSFSFCYFKRNRVTCFYWPWWLWGSIRCVFTFKATKLSRFSLVFKTLFWSSYIVYYENCVFYLVLPNWKESVQF